VVETNAGALIRVLRGIPGTRNLCLEEGTHASWLYEVLAPHVEEIVVAGVRESRGPKSDKLDTFGLAEQLRVGGAHLANFFQAPPGEPQRNVQTGIGEVRLSRIFRTQYLSTGLTYRLR
jgi:hypothetical protein